MMGISSLLKAKSDRTSVGETLPTDSDEPGSASADALKSDLRLKISDFIDARVEDVMVPRAEIDAIELNASLQEIIETFEASKHSRLPVYRETLDDPAGMIHIKDVLTEVSRQQKSDGIGSSNTPLFKLRRDVLFVPPSMKLPDLLVKMQSRHLHMALVIDEYGGTDGLVTIEDLIEQIVGDIEDEHDKTEKGMLIQASEDHWILDARLEIEDFEKQAGLSLSLPDYEDEIDTLGGLAFALAGRVPERGEVLSHPNGVEIEILDADPRRIKRIKLHNKA